MPDTEGSPTLRQSAPSDVYHELLEHAADAIWVHDLDGRLTYANRATENLLGQPRDSLLGSDVFELAHALRMHTSALKDEAVIEFDLGRPSGETTPVEASIRLLRVDGRPTAVQVIARDVRGRREQAELMRRRAFHDPLTDMPNRALLNDRLTQAMRLSVRHRRPFATLLVDLDGFKAVNDMHGHQVGDDVLREVAIRFKRILRTSDTCARYGGDEFVLLLPETDLEGAQMVAGNIHEALAPPIRLHDLTLGIGASIGIAVYPDHADPARPFDVRLLLSRADAAMYAAKRSGRPFALFGSEAPHARRRGRPAAPLDVARRRIRATSAAALAAAVLAAVVTIPGSPSREDNLRGRSTPLWQAGPEALSTPHESLLEAASEANGRSHRVRSATFRTAGISTSPEVNPASEGPVNVIPAGLGSSGGGRTSLAAPPTSNGPPSPPQGGTVAPPPGKGSQTSPPASGRHPTSSPSKGNGDSGRKSGGSPGGSSSNGGSSPGTGPGSGPSGTSGNGNSGHAGGSGNSGSGPSTPPGSHGSSNAGHGSSNASHAGPSSSASGKGSSNAGGASPAHGSSNGHGSSGGPSQGHGKPSGAQPSRAQPSGSAGGGPKATGPSHGGSSAPSNPGNSGNAGAGNGRR